MKISVIIPTYNRADLVQRAIKSVLNQTKKPDEIIVVDDGSTDNTKQILKNYPVKILYQKNKGVSSARNLGIKNAKYEFIAFLDSDDEWIEEKLEEQIKLHKRTKAMFLHSNEIWLKDGKIKKQKKHHQKPDGECFYQNLEFCKISPSTVLIHKSIFDEVGYFDEELEVCEDFDMWLRILKKYPIKLCQKELTIKHSGNYPQLSFKYFAMDIFRIKALLKHLPDKKVQKVIEKKLNILKKGAIKHNNSKIMKICNDFEKIMAHKL